MAFSGEALTGFIQEIGVATVGLTEAAAVQAMVTAARYHKNRVMTGSPRPSGVREIVDNVEGVPFERVRPDGTIVLAWQYFGEAARLVRDLFIAGAPLKTGNYIRNILVLVDGVDGVIEDVTPDTRQIMIVPAAVYARRLEVGRLGDRAAKIKRRWAHNVERTAIVARSLYGALVNIEFRYVELVGSYRLKTTGSHRKKRGRMIIDLEYPALVLTPRTA